MLYSDLMVSHNLIREARLRAGLTQAELAARLGKAQSEIGRWERGAVTPSLETLRLVVRACGLDLSFSLVPADDSVLSLIDQQLAMSPAQRYRHSQERAAFRAKRDRVRAAV
jgi:transcriptional regulator with XRE-family HTH domain